MFETKEGLEKGMREATKNLEESRGLAKLHIEIVFKWEVLRSATQACLEQEIPFSKCHRRASSGALMNRRFGMCDIENWESQAPIRSPGR